MLKKIVAFTLIALTSFLFINQLQASSNDEIILNFNNNIEKYNHNFKDLIFNYQFSTKQLKLKDKDNKEIFTKTINSNNNIITFNYSDYVIVSCTDERGFMSKKPIKLDVFKIEVFTDHAVLYDGLNEMYYADESYNIYIDFNVKPAISGIDSVVNNIDKPYTIEEIRNIINLHAFDEYDGDITSKIVIKNDNYTPNKNKVGVFDVEFSVTNTSNLTTTYKVNIVNKDFTKPVITGPDELEYSYKEQITLEEIKNLYSATDNYDTNINIQINQVDITNVGSYTLEVIAKDSSNNETKKAILLNIIDDVKPVITDLTDGQIKINYKDKITNELLLLELTATDEIDGDLTNRIKIIENNIINKIGKYKVKYEVKDNSGNTTIIERTYEVFSIDVPQFFVSKNVLSIEEVNKMTIEELAEVLSKINNIELQSFEILKDEYTGNENKEGVYQLSIKIIDTNNNEFVIDQIVKVFSKNQTNKFNYKPLLIGVSGLLILIGSVVIIRRYR